MKSTTKEHSTPRKDEFPSLPWQDMTEKPVNRKHLRLNAPDETMAQPLHSVAVAGDEDPLERYREILTDDSLSADDVEHLNIASLSIAAQAQPMAQPAQRSRVRKRAMESSVPWGL